MAIGGANTVGSGVTAPDDDDMPVPGQDLPRHALARHDPVLRRQEFKCKVDAGKLAPRHREVPRLLGATGQHNRVKVGRELLRTHEPRARTQHGPEFDLLAAGHQHAGAKLHALAGHLIDAPVDERLLQLEIGDAIAPVSYTHLTLPTIYSV